MSPGRPRRGVSREGGFRTAQKCSSWPREGGNWTGWPVEVRAEQGRWISIRRRLGGLNPIEGPAAPH